MKVITNLNDETGIKFTTVQLPPNSRQVFHAKNEMAFLQMSGTIEWTVEEETVVNTRNSLFDESPFAVHVPAGAAVSVQTGEENAEICTFETENKKEFPIRIFTPEMTENEHRGKGFVGDTSLRFVRTIFDGSTSHPNTELVLGEVVNFPGKWSSYPPHHHPQPEIYHYRFTHPQGYGHAELGEEVRKVRHGDTIKITDLKDHSQCAAPGYGMYYIWVIRHLPNNRYTVPEFTEEHKWTMSAEAKIWEPKVPATV